MRSATSKLPSDFDYSATKWSHRCRVIAGSGRTTVESCRLIDVLDWHRRGCLRSPWRFSWAWGQDGEGGAAINVGTGNRARRWSRSLPLPYHFGDLIDIIFIVVGMEREAQQPPPNGQFDASGF